MIARLFIALPAFLLFLLPLGARAEEDQNGFYPDNIFSHGSLGYGPLLVDSKATSLYVGARGHFFKLWLYNINQTSSEHLFMERGMTTPAEERAECETENSPTECDTAVRLIFQTGKDLLLCIASGMKPQLLRLSATTLEPQGFPRTLIGICAPQAGLNTTAVLVEEGNPDGIPSVYSGIRTGLTLENYLVYRPPLEFNNRQVHAALSTIYTDSKWLNEPHFVGSFAHDQYVYFFFREVAMEAEACGPVVYSRVARICKRDLGGKNVLQNKWSSFVKARLNCSMSTSQYPFHFDHMHSMEKVTLASDTLIYASFSTAESPFTSSAVCVFSLNAVNRVFDTGLFLGFQEGLWTPTIPDAVPVFRPGSCVPDSRALPDSDVHFAQSHLLMAEAVSAMDVVHFAAGRQFGKLVVDVRDEDTVILFVLVPGERRVLKLLHSRSGYPVAVGGRVLAEYRLPFPQPVNALAVLPNDYLFVADDERVSQYRLAQCHLYADCGTCAVDPHCSWNIARAECFPQETVHSTAVGWITNAKSAERCAAYVRSESRTIFPGDSLFLACQYAEGEWLVDREPVTQDSEHLKLARDGGLVLLNVTAVHSATYQCVVHGTPVVDYLVRVDEEECTRPTTVEQFHSIQREWCRKFDSYKSNMQKWQRWYDNNSHCPRVPEELSPSSHHKKAVAF